jgi:hypothetical protein
MINLSNPINEIDGATRASDRRTVVRDVGVAVLIVQMLPWIAHAAANSSNDGIEAKDDLTIHSSPGLFSHVHDLLIPYTVLRTPPRRGVELTTTKALFHAHSISFTWEQPMIVNQGGTIAVKSSSHFFMVALAKGQNQGQAGSGNRADVAVD